MRFLADTLYLVGLLFFVYGLAGVVNPAWMKSYKTGAVPSRLEALLVAVTIPQVFAFLGGLGGEVSNLKAFLGISCLGLGIWGFYQWGLLGVLEYMQLNRPNEKTFSGVPTKVLATVPAFGFVLLTFGLNTSHNPTFFWLLQGGLFALGWFILARFGAFFKIPFLPFLYSGSAHKNQSPEQTLDFQVLAPQAENKPSPTQKVSHPPAKLAVRQEKSTETFSFAYAEDDGQVRQIQAYALAAGLDRYSKRYLTGICHPASERRVFWLSRVLGSVTQDATGQQWEPQTVFDSLDPVIAPRRV